MSSEQERQNSTRGSLRLAPNVEELEEHKRKLPRQFVNFTFYRARPEWRLLSEDDKTSCKQSFITTVDDFRSNLLIHTYSTVGLRASADFLIWRLWCVAEQAVQRQERPLMSLPTWPDGRIDPIEFARRVAAQPRHEQEARHGARYDSG